MGILYGAIIVLIALSAVFSASETSFSSFNRIRLKDYSKKGDKRAARTLKVAEDYDKVLTAVLICNNIVNIAAASICTVIFTHHFGASGAAVATLVITVLVLIFGEVLPKSFAKSNAESCAMAFSGMLSVIIVALKPFIALFSLLSGLIASITGRRGREIPSVTEQELKYIIEEIEDEGVLESVESELVRSALDFDEITVAEILIPRVDVTAIEAGTPLEEVKTLFFTERYSRIPVYEKTIDNILGILYVKDFFKAYIDKKDFPLTGIIQKAFYVPDSMKISEVLSRMQKSKHQMAIALDQHGGFEGVVTLEDILEELVGEIWDEDDEIEYDVVEVSENKFKVMGDIKPLELFKEIGYEPEDFKSDSNTVSGWALEAFQKIPEVNESFICSRLKLTVSELDEKRIIAFTAEILPDSDSES